MLVYFRFNGLSTTPRLSESALIAADVKTASSIFIQMIYSHHLPWTQTPEPIGSIDLVAVAFGALTGIIRKRVI
jgi:hypothetical protein